MYEFSMTSEELEETADIAKVLVLSALVKDGLIDKEKADEWAAATTFVHRKKTIFRTLTDKWKNEKEVLGKYYLIIVSRSA